MPETPPATRMTLPTRFLSKNASWRAGGGATDQIGFQDDVSGLAVVLVAETPAEEIDGRLAECVHRLVNGGEGGLDQSPEEDVVNPDDGYVARHRQPHIAHRRAGAERVHVVEGNDSGRTPGTPEQLGRGASAVIGRVGVVEAEGRGCRSDQIGICRDARFAQRVEVAALPLLSRDGGGWPEI